MMTGPLIRRAGAACALSVLAAFPGISQADDSEVTALRQEVKELKSLLQELATKFDARLNRLEHERSTGAGDAASASAPPPNAQTTDSPQVQPQSPAVEHSASPQRPVTVAQAQDYSFREGWLKMKDGMTQAEINQLLGPPQKTFILNGKTVWYYYYAGVGPASVFFNPDGRASSHQAPTFGIFSW